MSLSSVIVIELKDVQRHPRPEVEKLDLCVAQGWQAVVSRGKYKDGDKVAYFQMGCTVPAEMADRLNIRSYLSRDWGLARDAKDAFWAARIARLGPIEGLRVADELRRQVVRLNPAWPDEDERQDDLQAHQRLSDLQRVRHPSGR